MSFSTSNSLTILSCLLNTINQHIKFIFHAGINNRTAIGWFERGRYKLICSTLYKV